MQLIKTIGWDGDEVVMLDQRLLPSDEVYLKYRTYKDVGEAIRTMVVRGAPAIGVAAAMGAALGARDIDVDDFDEFYKDLCKVCDYLFKTRPTAVNLPWAIDRMKETAIKNKEFAISEIKRILKNESIKILNEDLEANETLGRLGAGLLKDGDVVLTHCNAGALATSGYGTALGVIYAAVDSGKKIKVFADETRPRLQGARLTAWELAKHNVDVTLITDNMAGSLMMAGRINACIVGADRIAANGDTANKIGTYGVAVLAKYHNIPFYVAAPWSTVDVKIKDGVKIPIEERDHDEVTMIGNERIAPKGIKIINPAFDVTPASLITAIITEKGIFKQPFQF